MLLVELVFLFFVKFGVGHLEMLPDTLGAWHDPTTPDLLSKSFLWLHLFVDQLITN